MSTWIVLDVESDGPCPGLYSMVSFGAVVVSQDLAKEFYGRTAPISDQWVAEALAISNISREDHLKFPKPEETMPRFNEWLHKVASDKLTFVSDNPAFDWQFMNYYFHKYCGNNPFGFSARRIGDLYCGLVRDAGKNAEWKKRFRKTKHTHNPVDDARGNAEALLEMKRMGLKIHFD